MFKKLALSGLLLSLLSLPLLAQQTAAPAAPTVSRGQKPTSQYKAGDPATRAKKMTDRMTQDLGLDQATSQKVYEASLARDQKVDAIQTGSDDNKTKDKALKANADDYKSKLQSILTPDQFTKFQSMKGNHMRNGQGGPNSGKDSNDQK